MTVVEFLLARIAEDEAVARAAINRGQGVWEWTDEHSAYSCIVEGDDIRIYDEGGHDEHQAQHIARHNPARALAECAAKRAIVESWRQADQMYGGDVGAYMDGVLRALASVYADHPGYNDEWK